MLGSVSSMGGGAQVWSGASMQNYSHSGASQFFNSIDTTGKGSISQAEFEQSLKSAQLPKYAQGLSPSELWSKIDPAGAPTVSKQDFLKGLSELRSSKYKNHKPKEATESPFQTILSSLGSINSLSNDSKITGVNLDAKV